MASRDPKKLFTHKVSNYIQFRPDYPEALFSYIDQAFNLGPDALIADIGSGTGLMAGPLLERGYRVVCVEPNENMRKAGRKALSGYSGYQEVDGSGEATNLPDHSVDVAVVAQAFHWMDQLQAKKELLRIVKPGGIIAILWILLKTDTPFMQGYEDIRATFGTGYTALDRANESKMRKIFTPYNLTIKHFVHSQPVEYRQLEGHLLSASFIPSADKPEFGEMLDALRNLFEANQQKGIAEMRYETTVFHFKT